MNYIKLSIFIYLFFLCQNLTTIYSQDFVKNDYNKYFIENKGQWESEVLALSISDGLNCWITKTGMVLDYYKISQEEPDISFFKFPKNNPSVEATIAGHLLEINYLHSSEPKNLNLINKQIGYFNFFLGDNDSNHKSFVHSYKGVELIEIYSGIDLIYYFDQNFVRYDYRIKPNADISQIEIALEGADIKEINENGELEISLNIGDIKFGKLFSYQLIDGVKKEIECYFDLNTDGSIGINVGKYDKTKELIIDPLVYSTFLGCNGDQFGNSLVLDNENNVYVTGLTQSPDFPTTGVHIKLLCKALELHLFQS